MAKTEVQSPRTLLAKMRADLNKDAGHPVIGTLVEAAPKVEGYSTGNIALDYATGVKGYPVGRIVEQFGEYSSGKTTSALQALALEQQRIIAEGTDECVMFLDYERSIDISYCQNLGIDPNHESFVYLLPDSFEHGANIFREFLATGGVRIAVFDSVAAMVSEKETSAETGAATVADRAKAMHQFLRQITAACEKHRTTPIFLNHVMEKVDTTIMGQRLAARGIKRYTRPGGTALDFYASMLIEFKKAEKVKTTEVDTLANAKDSLVSGQNITATVVKNKVGAAFGRANLRVRFGRGFSQPYSVLMLLKSYKMVKVKGTWFEFPETLRLPDTPLQLQGEHAVLTAMENSPEWLALLEEAVSALLEEAGALPDKAEAAEYEVEEQVDPVTGEVSWEQPVALKEEDGDV